MRTNIIYLTVLAISLSGPAYGQEIKDFGVGTKMEHTGDYVRYQNGSEITYIIGTNPHAHLYRYTPHSPNSLFDVGPVLGNTPDAEKRSYIWDMCVDDVTGIVYGGTCAGSAAIFRYDPSDINNEIFTLQLDYSHVSFLWSCVNTTDYVYYGTFPEGTLIRFDKSQEIVDPDFAFRPFTFQFVQDNYPEIFPLIWDDAYIDDEHNYRTQNGETYIRYVTKGPDGLIYGGTNHGFVFAYDPVEDTMGHLNIWQELDYPGIHFHFVDVIEGNSEYVFGGTYKSEEFGNIAYRIDFYNPEERVKILKWSTLPNSDTLHCGYFGIIENTLYGPYYKYDISTETAQSIGQSGRFTTFDESGDLFWGVVYDKYVDYEFRIYNFSTDEVMREPVYDMNERDKIPPYGGEWIKSITSDDHTVYGGNYFASGVVAHDIYFDYIPGPSADWYGSFYGQTDALMAYDRFIYCGQYSGVGIGIYDPSLYTGYLNMKPAFGDGAVPDINHNPLLKSIFVDSTGHSISLNLVRVNCFTAESNRNMVYFGPGPMGGEVADAPAWVIRYNCNVGSIVHLLELSEEVPNIMNDMKEIKDIEYFYDTVSGRDLLFVVGSLADGLVIIDITDLNNVFVPRQSDQIYANRLIIDESTGKLYLSLYNKMRIYNSVYDVIAHGFGNPADYVETENVGAKILDLVKGNDGMVYFSYGPSIGKLDGNNEYTEIGSIPLIVSDEEAFCLGASTDISNLNIYIGSRYGHMFMVDVNDYQGPFRNEEVVTRIGIRSFFSEDALWLKTGVHGIFMNAERVAVGDFDGNGNDELVIAYEDGSCYLRDDPNDLYNDVLVHTGPPYVSRFAVGDFDGDDDDEIITAFDDNTCHLSEDARDLDSGSPVSSGYAVFDFAVGDLDGDRDDDIITAFNDGHLCYLSDDASDLMSGSPVHDDANIAVMHFAVGDFDGNENDDVITAFDIGECRLSDTGLDLYGGDLVEYGDFVEHFAVGDFDGDLDDEVVTAFFMSGCFLSEDGRNLDGGLQVYGGVNITNFGVGDFDGDGDDDLLTAFLTEYPDFQARATLSDQVYDLWNAREVYSSSMAGSAIGYFTIGDFTEDNILCHEVSDLNIGPLVPGKAYVVACDVEVPDGQTLTVNSGATVYFSENTRLTANGVFDVFGSVGNPVVFMSNDYQFRGRVIVKDRFTVRGGGIFSLSSLMDIKLDKEIRDKEEEILFLPEIDNIPAIGIEPASGNGEDQKTNVPLLKAKDSKKNGGKYE